MVVYTALGGKHGRDNHGAPGDRRSDECTRAQFRCPAGAPLNDPFTNNLDTPRAPPPRSCPTATCGLALKARAC